VLAAASTTPAAGAADNLTITAKDSAGITVTAYTGSHNLSFAGAGTIGSFHPTVSDSSGTATNFGTATTIAFSNGVATVSGSANGVMRLYRAETASITVAEGGSYTSNTLSVTVGAGAIDSFAVPNPGTRTAGTPFPVSLTAVDAYGNTKTDFTGSHCITFSGPASSPNGTAPSYPPRGACAVGQSAVSFTTGVAGPSVTLYNASASTTLAVTDSASGKSGSSGAFGVSPLAASSLLLSAATTTPAAGQADNLTVTARDVYGNTATSYTGSHSLTFSGATAIGAFTPSVTNSSGVPVSFGTATALNFVSGVATVSGSANGAMTLYRMQTANISASGGGFTTNTLVVTVAPGALGSFTIPNPGTRTAGSAFNISLTAFDSYGNSATNYTGTRCLAFSGPSASPNGTAPSYPSQGSCGSGQSAVTFTNGSATGVSITLYDDTASTALTATDAPTGNGGSTGNFAVNGLTTMGGFVLSADDTTPTAGQAVNVTITATDAYGNDTLPTRTYRRSHTLTFSGASTIGTVHPTVTNQYGGTVDFGDGAFLYFANDNTATTVMRLYAVETAEIHVNAGGYGNGNELQITVGPAAISGFSLSAEKIVVRPGAADNLTVRAVDPYGNTVPSFGGLETLRFAGASPSGGQNPTVTDSTGVARNFGVWTQISFTNGIASTSGAANGVMHLYALERANVTVTNGAYTSAPLSVVVSNRSASAISAGGFHSCALVGGQVECWGYNNYGQVGDGTTTQRNNPVLLANPTNVTQLSAGKYHTCALRSNGTVYCWGQNTYGQIGDGTNTNRHSPTQVRLNAGTYLTDAVQVSSGGGHTCAIRSNGTVWCWGYNPFGQLGNNSITSTTYPVQASGINNAAWVAAGHNHSCALLSDNTVWCWGYNAYGEVGDGSTLNRTTPRQVVGPGGSGYLTGVTGLSSGRFHSCALLSDGSAYCWGDNDNGELGDGTTTSSSIPVRAGEISTAVTVNAGEYHSCVSLQDGTAQCWGAAAFGQVGDGTTADATSPVTVIGPGGYGVLSGVAAISAGGGNWPDGAGSDNYEHTCALLSDGTVVSWGQNIYGQLGNGTTTMSISPVGILLQ